MSTRPAATYSTGPAARTIRVIAAGIAAITITAALLAWNSLPARIPTHVDATGTPDDWGPRWTLLALLGVWAVMQAGLTWLSTRPRLFNYPVPVTEGNAQHLYREGERMMVGVCLGVAITFAGVTGMAYDLETGALVVVGLVVLGVISIAGLVRTSMAGTG